MSCGLFIVLVLLSTARRQILARYPVVVAIEPVGFARVLVIDPLRVLLKVEVGAVVEIGL